MLTDRLPETATQGASPASHTITDPVPGKVCLSVDMEQDCPPFMDTFSGIAQGTPVLLDILARYDVSATFFFTGEVARKFPKTVEAVLARGHEIGCHGDSHQVFTDLSPVQARNDIAAAMSVLRPFGRVISFRAPNLAFPESYLPILKDQGILLDSSLARYKISFLGQRHLAGLTRVPVSVTSSVLRLPHRIKISYLRCLSDPVVLFVHPWEFVDLRQTRLRYDCRFNTGSAAAEHLAHVLGYYRQKGAVFCPITGLLPDGVVKNLHLQRCGA